MTYIPIITDVPLAPVAIANLVKCNCTKSSWRLGQCVVKRPMTTLFAYSLDNGVVCQSIRKLITSALLIQVMPKSRLICFSMLLPLQKTGFLISVQSDGLVPVQYKLWTDLGYDILFLPGLSKIFMCWSSKASQHWVSTLK